MSHPRQYQSAMLIPPECACVANSELPSVAYGDQSRNRTASLPSIAMTQGYQLSMCPDKTLADNGYLPDPFLQRPYEGDTQYRNPPGSILQPFDRGNTGTYSNHVPDSFQRTSDSSINGSGRIPNIDTAPTLPCSRPVMVRPSNICGGRSNPELGNIHGGIYTIPHTNTTTSTNTTIDICPPLQRQYNSLLGVNFSTPSSNSSPLGGSLSHLDNRNDRRHRRNCSSKFDSSENPFKQNTSSSDLSAKCVELDNPSWREQSFYQSNPMESNNNIGVNENTGNSTTSLPQQIIVNSIDTCTDSNHAGDDCDKDNIVPTSWSTFDTSPVDNKNNAFLINASPSESIRSEYDNFPSASCPNGVYLNPSDSCNIIKTESWPRSSNGNQRQYLGVSNDGNASSPCDKDSKTGEFCQGYAKPKEIDFITVDIESENDESGNEDASSIPLLKQPCENDNHSSQIECISLDVNGNGSDEQNSNKFSKNSNQGDSQRGSFSEKQKRNRKFRRKNSSNLIISQTAHHRNEFGKAAKRLCLWKQKLAKSRQTPQQPPPTTNDTIPMHAMSSNSVNTHPSFNVTSPNTSTSPYCHDNENDSLCGTAKKSKNATKQKYLKKSKAAKSTTMPTPTIVLSAPPADNTEDPYCSMDTGNAHLDSDTIHSSDYDTMDGFPSSRSSTGNGSLYLQHRSDLNPKHRGVGSGLGSSLSSSSARRPFRLRRNSRRLACNGHKAEFTVVPVKNETNLREQEKSKRRNDDSSLRVPVSGFEIDGEPTDTLTQNSITSLLSAKFRDVAKRWKQYGVESPRFRKRIHSKWESMNYDSIDSKLSRELEHDTSKKKLAMTWLAQWFIYFLIGIGTALLAAGVQISVEIIAHEKFDLIKHYLDKCSSDGCSLIIPVMIWVGMNAGISLLAAALVTFVQPMAAGSGIPLIKSYLNGVRIPGLLSLRAFIAKCVGVILSILGGLACGKEGPMAHSGGIMGAGLGKGRIPWFGKDISLYGMFRNDHNIRDLVAAGAASGVSAAFGAPVGGTLFSVEEAASFWNTELVWKVFFSAMIACFSTNFLLSAFEGHPTQLSNPGLVRFNTFPNLTFDLIEIPVFIFLAVIGGLTGSLFVVMNYKLTVFRQKYLHRRNWIKCVEAAVVAVVSAIVAFVLMYTVNDCTEATPRSHHAILTKMGCEGNAHNSMSTLFLTTPEGCLKSLLHDPLETYSVLTLVLFIVIFFLLGVWTYGLSVSSGVFIPSLAIGAAWGRLIGMGVVELFPDQAKDVGKYALIGAASQLGGILRTTISLTVIIVECTGDVTFGLCIMISLMISKWVGDFFTTGLYDMNVEVSGIPLLSWDPPPLCEHVKVSDFMSQPVMSMLQVEKVGHVMECLKGENFHGFPIIEQDPSYDLMYKGKLRGLILRSQLLVLLKNKAFCPEGDKPRKIIDLTDFDNPYPVSQRLSVRDIELTEEEKEQVIDLGPYMSQTPYIVSPNFSMPRTFRLFRGLGLRHLVIINEEFEPVGMVTRKDLAKYRAGIKKGMLHMEQLTVENR